MNENEKVEIDTVKEIVIEIVIENVTGIENVAGTEKGY